MWVVPPPTTKRACTALCLCGGGITGVMYEIGALMALDDFFSPSETLGRAFTVSDFDVYVGTSAGAFVATMLAAGMSARRLFQGVLDGEKAFMPVRRTDVYRFDLQQGFGVVRDLAGILISAVTRAARFKLGFSELITDFADVLPAGIFSLRHYEKFLESLLVKQNLPTRFSELAHELYITANDLDSGHRAIFGQGPLADAPIAKAICASSAIPVFFEPVRWNV